MFQQIVNLVLSESILNHLNLLDVQLNHIAFPLGAILWPGGQSGRIAFTIGIGVICKIDPDRQLDVEGSIIASTCQ